ncbi:MAG: class I SAM-dependent methyltransferase [Actinoplanes sp.]
MQNRASRTAEQVALFRALESARGPNRLFDDPYAARFLTGGYRLAAALARVRPVGRGLERFIDTRWPAGPRASAVARTRLIDDLAAAALAAGATQVVLLGAGYDSRAHRLPAMAGARVFEVDHPATQAVKRRLLGDTGCERLGDTGHEKLGDTGHERLGATGHAGLRFVPADLLHDDLGEALTAAGFRPERTVVIWEGVTNYLTEPAVDATLRLLAARAAPGSRIILTYVDRSVLTSDDDWPAAVRRQGEPWTFGFDPAELPGYLAARGLRLTLDLSTSDAAARYLRPLGRDEPTAAFYHVAEAEIS